MRIFFFFYYYLLNVDDRMIDVEKYFNVPAGSWSYKPNQFTIYSGLNWNGYYVLANDIDASYDEDPRPTT